MDDCGRGPTPTVTFTAAALRLSDRLRPRTLAPSTTSSGSLFVSGQMTTLHENSEGFVADGRERLLQDPAAQAALEAEVARIESKYAELLAAAGWFRRLAIRHAMRSEIRQAVE